MHSEPIIVWNGDLSTRGYIKVYINGERYRFYNGKAIGLKCFPNECSTVKERHKALASLLYHVKRRLQEGWNPGEAEEEIRKVQTIGEVLLKLKVEIEHEDLSAYYKRDLEKVRAGFADFLLTEGFSNLDVLKVDSRHVQQFLKQFNGSSCYYMNKRRTLGGLFSRLVDEKIVTVNPVYETATKKEATSLNEAYSKEQMRAVLDYLKVRNTHLYLCALLMYGTFLRPHQEIRRLRRKNFDDSINTITLGGNANKGKGIRVVHVPEYVREVLYDAGLPDLDTEMNLFTGAPEPFNESYFNTIWGKCKRKLMNAGLISANHTLYSFRHSGAVNLYMKTKDPYKVQQAFGHSSLTVTLTYLRSLGLMNRISADDMPEL